MSIGQTELQNKVDISLHYNKLLNIVCTYPDRSREFQLLPIFLGTHSSFIS